MKPSARHLMPKALKHKTGFSAGEREHHSAFRHPGVSDHKGGEWSHGKEDDMHMSHPGMHFGDSNPDEAVHMTGIHKGGKHPRLEHIHRMLVKK
jgi:hypothetical protein